MSFGTAYAIWAGSGTAAIVGDRDGWFLGEGMTLAKATGIALILSVFVSLKPLAVRMIAREGTR